MNNSLLFFPSTQGYIAGNPLTDEQFDTDGRIPFLHGMGLVSDELYEVIIHHLMKAHFHTMVLDSLKINFKLIPNKK